ncbi:copper resistance protein CopC [Streptomyces sp. NPDC003077]|uniref:copper resistance protein CopC n=1 Tax=Streptomyces sp. NPDC003077 TaxID=3154443 RepID=UPI00339F3C47
MSITVPRPCGAAPASGSPGHGSGVPRAAGAGRAPRDRRSAVPRLLVLVAALLAALLGTAAPASAHAALTGSTPAQGAVVDRAPEQVALTFSEGVAMGDDSIRVLDPQGKRVDRGKLRDLCSGGVVKYGAGLPPGLPDGTYTVAWQAVSADSHPVSGAFTFSIGAPSKTSAPVPQQEAGGGVVGALYGIARYLSYAGYVLLVGGGAFVLLCRPAAARVRAVRRLVVQGWAVLTGATLAMLLLRGPYTGSGRLGDVFDFGGLGAVLQTKPGAALLSRLLLLATATLFVAVLFGAYARTLGVAGVEENGDGGNGDGAGADSSAGGGGPAAAAGTDSASDSASASDSGDEQRRRDLSIGLGVGGLVLAVGLAATWAMAEHASTGLQTGIAMPVDVLHLLAVATWLGGLCALLVSLYWGPSVERSSVRRFSRLAFGSVVVLAATGVYQSWRQVGSWKALTDTSYGRLLLLKVGLIAVLLGIAWMSRRWTARIAERTAPEAEAVAVLEAKAEAEARTAALGVATGTASDAGSGADAVPGADAGSGAGVEDASGRRSPTGVAVRAGRALPEPRDGSGPAAVPGPPAGADSGPGSGTPSGSASGVRSDGVSDNASDDDVDDDEGAAAEDTRRADSPAADTGTTDPERAAQLARQRTALASARRKRVRDADPERSGLRRSVLAEAVVAVVLLAVTTVLTSTEPARTEEAVRAAQTGQSSRSNEPLVLTIPFDTGGPKGKGTARIDLDPGRSGNANELHLRVADPSGRAVDVPEVKVSFTLESKKLGPLPVVPEHVSVGHWSASGVQLPVAGKWQLSLLVRTSDIDQVTKTKNVTID